MSTSDVVWYGYWAALAAGATAGAATWAVWRWRVWRAERRAGAAEAAALAAERSYLEGIGGLRPEDIAFLTRHGWPDARRLGWGLDVVRYNEANHPEP